MSCVTDTHEIAVRGHGDTPLVLRASRHPHRAVPAGRWLKQAGERIKRARAAWRYRRADAVVALSEQAATALRTMIGKRAIPVETIHNPVVDRTWLDDPSPRPANDPPLILGIGRFTRQKDFGTLLGAFALLRRERPARLMLLGEGPDRGALEALARELGIADDVEMPGELRAIDAQLRRADLLVSSSLWEGMQATVIEALAAGCPVVATDCPGGAREVLEEGRLGELVPVADPGQMAAAMARQLARAHDPAELARGATRFLVAGKAALYLDLFDQAGARRR
jgi:glycosyltransferase involved in cell wall biosynthesis